MSKTKKQPTTKKQTATKKQPRKNTLITDFYPEVTSVPFETPIEKEKNQIDEFYSSHLNVCQKKTCVVLKSELEKQLAAAKLKLLQIEKAQTVLQSICTEKDQKIETLQRNIDSIGTPNRYEIIDSALPATERNTESIEALKRNDIIGATLSACEQPFNRFVGNFTVGRLDTIRLLGATISEDSTFILEIIRSLYADNLKELDNITVTGRSKSNSKVKMSPKNIEILSSMFEERLAAQPYRNVRLRSLNPLISRSIVNITRGLKNKNCEEQLMSKINETFKENEK